MSQMNAVQLYRPSVAQRQKEMLNLSLQKLEEASLSAQSSTKEEASLRMQEAQLISRFVAKARTVVPKGEVILNESNIDSVLLEDGDVINIPEKTSLVMVHGEVLFPNAVSWQKGMTTEDYIEKCGGLTQNRVTPELSSFVRTVQPSTQKMWIHSNRAMRLWFCRNMNRKTLKLPVVFPPSSISWRWVQK